MRNNVMDLKRQLTIAAVLFLLIVALSLTAASMASVARGAGTSYSFYATPSTGAKYSHANVVGTGLPEDTTLTFLFGTVQVGVITSSPEGKVDITITVPLVSPGRYVISAKDSAGITRAATGFTVVENQPTASPTASDSPTPNTGTPKPSQYPSPTFHVYPITTLPPYSYNPSTPKPAEGALSPLMIGIIVAAIVAIVIPVTFFVRRSGGPQPTYDEANETPAAPAPTYSPRTGTAPISPAVQRSSISSRFEMFEQPVSRPFATPRYGQSQYSRPSAVATKMCPRCRQTIRADYSVCPHCNKRLK